MKALHIIIALVIANCPLSVQSQNTKTKVAKSAAYFKVNSSGTVMVDEDGNTLPPLRDTVHFAFFEIPTNQNWVVDTVIYKKHKCSFNTTSFSSPTTIPLIVLLNGSAVKWPLKKGNKLLVIEYRKQDEPVPVRHLPKNPFIIIKSHRGTKKLLTAFEIETELKPDERM